MGKRYLPVVLRGRSFRMYQDDFKFIKCIKKTKKPSIPSFDRKVEDRTIDEIDVFVKTMD